MPKRKPSILKRAESRRSARIVRAAQQARAAKAGPAAPMHFPGYGGQGYNNWHYLMPGSQADHAVAAGDLWLNTAVAASLGWIKRNFGEPTLEVVRDIPEGAVEVVPRPASVALLNRPNPFYDRHTFWAAIVLSYVVDGNVYLRKIRAGRDNVIELWWIPHWLVGPRWPSDGTQFISHYIYEVNGREERIEVADIIHLRDGIDPRDDRRGYSAVKTAVRQVCGLNEADTYTTAILRNMGVPGVMISSALPDGNFQPDEIDGLRNQWRENFTSEGRGAPFFFPTPMKLEKVSFSPEQMALDRIPARLEAAVCAAIGVPAMVIGLASGAEFKTYSNWLEARKAAYQDYLVPVQKAIADGLTHQLLIPDFDEGDRFRWDYSTVQCLQEDETQTADRLGRLYQQYQTITRAEAREALGFDFTDEDEIYYPEAMLRYRDYEDLLGDDQRPDGPNKLGPASSAAEAKQVPIDQDALTAMESSGSKKSEPLDTKKIKDATGASRSAPVSVSDLKEYIDYVAGRLDQGDIPRDSDGNPDFDSLQRDFSPGKTHKASSAEAILATALRRRSLTKAYKDGTLDDGQRHDVLGEISDYATDWLRHEATAFFATYGATDDDRGLEDATARSNDADRLGILSPDGRCRDISDRERPANPDDLAAETRAIDLARTEALTDDGADLARTDQRPDFPAMDETGGQAGGDIRPEDRGVERDVSDADRDARGIDSAKAAHLSRLFARAKQFTRECHIAGAMALTGPAPLSAEDLADLEQSSRDQDGYFAGFQAELLSNPPDALAANRAFGGAAQTVGQTIGRFGAYGRDIWGRSLNWLRNRFRRKSPQMQERRLMTDGVEHCSECPGLADMGWQPIGTLPDIGECECHQNDRCSFRYRESPAS